MPLAGPFGPNEPKPPFTKLASAPGMVVEVPVEPALSLALICPAVIVEDEPELLVKLALPLLVPPPPFITRNREGLVPGVALSEGIWLGRPCK